MNSVSLRGLTFADLVMSTAERIMWGAWGLLSFIALIIYLRWVGTRDEDQQKSSEMPKESNANQERVD